MRISLFILILCVTASSFGQMIEIKEKNSYYLGYRGAVNVAANLQPTLHTSFATDQKKTSLIGAVLAPSIGYTFALSNKVSVQLMGEIHKTTRDSRDIYDMDPRVVVRNQGRTFYLDEETGTPQYSGRALALKFNFHLKKRAALAPIGSHISLGVKQTWLKANHSNITLSEYVFSGTSDLKLTLDDFIINHQMVSFTFDYVTRDMLTDKLFIDLGFGFATPPLQRSYYSNKKTDAINNSMVNATFNRYILHDVLRLSFGLGYVVH